MLHIQGVKETQICFPHIPLVIALSQFENSGTGKVFQKQELKQEHKPGMGGDENLNMPVRESMLQKDTGQ